MNIMNEYPVMIFKNENEYGTFYSLGLSKKNVNGDYENGYITCQFKKGVELDNQTKIYIRKAWLTFYKKEKQTVPYIMIADFETVSETIANSKNEISFKEDPFSAYGATVQIDDSFLD